MKTAREIYTQYKIMPSLKLHQLRVAAVGKMICEKFSEPLDSTSVITACLFHDMGNILKFNLSFFPDFLEPEGMAYWEKIQQEYRSRYGTVSHDANVRIAKELQLPPPVVSLIDGVGFSNLDHIAASGSFEQKICEYADLRVAPRGIESMSERLSDARLRYVKRDNEKRSTLGVGAPNDRFDELLRAGTTIEKQIFSKTTLLPDQITDVSAAPYIEELWDYQVS